MQFKKDELGLMNMTLNTYNCSKEERGIIKECLDMILTSTNEDKTQFVDGDLDLKTTQKALLIRALESGKWTNVQWSFVDDLISKLNN